MVLKTGPSRYRNPFLLIPESHPFGFVRRYGRNAGSLSGVDSAGCSARRSCEIASGMVGAELAISPGDRALDVAERRVHPFDAMRAACRPDPVPPGGCRRLRRVRSSSPVRPSQPPLRGPASLAPRAISRLRKPLTGASFSLRGRPSTGRDRRHEGRRPPRRGPACRRSALRRDRRRTRPVPCRAAPSPP